MKYVIEKELAKLAEVVVRLEGIILVMFHLIRCVAAEFSRVD